MRALWLLIRDHGDELEGDLAFRGIDLRDLYRRGSGMTLRRVKVLIKALPPDAAVWAALLHVQEQAKVPTTEQIRNRQEHYRARGN